MKRTLVIAVMLAVFVCAFAFGEDASQDTWVQLIWGKLFYALGIVLAGFVANLLSKITKKYGIEIEESNKLLIEQYAADAIAYADEWAYKKLKIDDVAVKSEEKFLKAVEQLLEKVPGLDAEKAKDMIVSKLPEFRAYLGDKLDAIIKDKLEKKDE